MIIPVTITPIETSVTALWYARWSRGYLPDRSSLAGWRRRNFPTDDSACAISFLPIHTDQKSCFIVACTMW